MARADDINVMSTSDSNKQTTDQRSTDHRPTSSTDEIAISASELIKMIESGHGTDVNELVNRMLHDRQAA